jgi:hypothetical protein
LREDQLQAEQSNRSRIKRSAAVNTVSFRHSCDDGNCFLNRIRQILEQLLKMQT